MAEVARARGLAVEVAPFERWNALGRTFDLPWPGRRGIGSIRSPARRRPRRCCGRADGSGCSGTSARRRASWPSCSRRSTRAWRREWRATRCCSAAAMRAPTRPWRASPQSRGFDAPQVRTFAWSRRHDTAQWLEILQTHSDHQALEPARRERLLAEVGRRRRLDRRDVRDALRSGPRQRATALRSRSGADSWRQARQRPAVAVALIEQPVVQAIARLGPELDRLRAPRGSRPSRAGSSAAPPSPASRCAWRARSGASSSIGSPWRETSVCSWCDGVALGEQLLGQRALGQHGVAGDVHLASERRASETAERRAGCARSRALCVSTART